MTDPRALVLKTPQELYELWERQQWSTHTIDFAQDREDWARLDADTRDELVWSLAAFFVGEERVTTQFSSLVRSYEDQSEEAYLTTQQVDEARHCQHFDRFHKEVLAMEGDCDARLEKVREHLTTPFVKLFDEHLVDAADRLGADPSNIEAKVDFVTTYHMVIEGILAFTGQYTVATFLEERNLLPGFLEGFDHVIRDEHRHLAYGTWFLREKAVDPRIAERIQRKLLELLPISIGALAPHDTDPFGDWSLLGVPSEDINLFGFKSLNRRLKIIGVRLPGGWMRSLRSARPPVPAA
jgi:ribonucleoside-diphosphate reductase beta chain